MPPKGIEGIIETLIATIDYITGGLGFEVLESTTLVSTEGRFFCLMAKGGDVIVKTSTVMSSEASFTADITLTPSESPLYGDFTQVTIDAASVGQLLVYKRPLI